jgi:hypothetical protein
MDLEIKSKGAEIVSKSSAFAPKFEQLSSNMLHRAYFFKFHSRPANVLRCSEAHCLSTALWAKAFSFECGENIVFLGITHDTIVEALMDGLKRGFEDW